jgi:hypothetical protein
MREISATVPHPGPRERRRALLREMARKASFFLLHACRQDVLLKKSFSPRIRKSLPRIR